jgi:hypothetical protein
MANTWTADQIIRIVSFGGGIDTDARRFTVEQAIRIASYAAQKGTPIIFRNTGHWTSEDAVRIASFGQGNVIFGD